MRQPFPIFFHVFIIVVAATASSCCDGHLSFGTETAGSQSFSDTLSLSLCLSSPGGIRVLDVFVFRDTLTFPLESHVRLSGTVPRTILIPSDPGDRIAAVIANSPKPFNIQNIRSLENLEQAEMYYRDDDPAFPCMSAVESISGNHHAAQLSALLCKVEIVEINKSEEGCFEDQHLSLKGVNSHVQVLRFDGFATVETEESPSAMAHPEMITCRLAPTQTSAVLWCYPFNGAGPSPPVIVFTALRNGVPFERSFPLPCADRGETIYMTLNI